MCLLLLALDSFADRPWLLLGNRDEFHARPTAPAQRWDDAPDVAGGRDLQARGSWLALQRTGRFAAVTNVRGGHTQAALRSRGELVADFVRGEASPREYVATVAAHSSAYGPFNLVVGDFGGAWFVSSLDSVPRLLARGVHAFSNGSAVDEWPKMRRLRARFGALSTSGAISDEALLDLLADKEQPADSELPNTGVGLQLERLLAPIFVVGEAYGTRASTLAYARADRSLVLHERRYGANAAFAGESKLQL